VLCLELLKVGFLKGDGGSHWLYHFAWGASPFPLAPGLFFFIH
jgi:hypothetical protein